jgi:hypothetical protein
MNKYMLGAGLVTLGALIIGVPACTSAPKEDASFTCDDATSDVTPGGAPVKNCMAPTKLKVFLMPDGFRNVAFGCNGKVGIYVTSRGWIENGAGDLPSLPSSISTVENDPNCP